MARLKTNSTFAAAALREKSFGAGNPDREHGSVRDEHSWDSNPVDTRTAADRILDAQGGTFEIDLDEVNPLPRSLVQRIQRLMRKPVIRALSGLVAGLVVASGALLWAFSSNAHAAKLKTERDDLISKTDPILGTSLVAEIPDPAKRERVKRDLIRAYDQMIEGAENPQQASEYRMIRDKIKFSMNQ